MAFNVENPSGASMRYDTYKENGGNLSGPSPVEALCSAVAACSAMDVVMILNKMRAKITTYSVEVEWDRGPKDVFPRPITAFRVNHKISGDGLTEGQVSKAIKLSEDKYCSVLATLNTTPSVEMKWEVS